LTYSEFQKNAGRKGETLSQKGTPTKRGKPQSLKRGKKTTKKRDFQGLLNKICQLFNGEEKGWSTFEGGAKGKENRVETRKKGGEKKKPVSTRFVLQHKTKNPRKTSDYERRGSLLLEGPGKNRETIFAEKKNQPEFATGGEGKVSIKGF